MGRNVPKPSIDFNHLLKARLIVARYGEMDLARWWNSNGILGPRGKTVLKRGFPITHCFVQARIAFAVARTRCVEIFDPPGCMTLWNLPAEVEERFEDHWQGWLDEGKEWAPFFDALAGMNGDDLLEAMDAFGIVSPQQRDEAAKLRRSAKSRAVPLPGTHAPNDHIITMLAAGFARGEPGSPAIPYARLDA